MKTIDQLKKVIQAANPEIMELKFGCEVDRGGSDKVKEFVCGTFNDRISLVVKTDLGYYLPFEVEKTLITSWKILGRPIRLADVLLFCENRANEGLDGMHPESQGDTYYEERFRLFNAVLTKWNLAKDSLDDQSPETIKFLSTILK